jgi:hypothetical protein
LRDTFIFADHFYKPVSRVLAGDEINICVTNFFSIRTDDCDSETFNNNLSGDVFVNINEPIKKSHVKTMTNYYINKQFFMFLS